LPKSSGCKTFSTGSSKPALTNSTVPGKKVMQKDGKPVEHEGLPEEA
jgi:hypothetical protein